MDSECRYKAAEMPIYDTFINLLLPLLAKTTLHTHGGRLQQVNTHTYAQQPEYSAVQTHGGASSTVGCNVCEDGLCRRADMQCKNQRLFIYLTASQIRHYVQTILIRVYSYFQRQNKSETHI